ncbi:MAG: Cof-type HAD-IIB family hydrolase [Clostridia bacterium]|nr:Cof-type HAD-IIB family hydrolase [Clostridia bacterium]
MYKLIAIDLDGTLLNSNKQISQKNITYIKYAIDRGIKVIICSGRIFAGARIFAKQMSIAEPLIACNGAIIKDMNSEEVLYYNSMNIGDCLNVIDMCHAENVYFHIYIGDTMYTEKLEFSSLFYWNKNKELSEDEKVDIKLVGNIERIVENCKAPVSKFVVISEDLKQLKRIREKVCTLDTIEVVSSNYNNFEVMNNGVNKANALKFLAGKMGIKREEIVAIGDNENDYSMIEYAGFGVAMENAEEKIKSIADFITLSNDQDGVAHIIKKIVL